MRCGQGWGSTTRDCISRQLTYRNVRIEHFDSEIYIVSGWKVSLLLVAVALVSVIATALFLNRSDVAPGGDDSGLQYVELDGVMASPRQRLGSGLVPA